MVDWDDCRGLHAEYARFRISKRSFLGLDPVLTTKSPRES
jgi:hypothetical protein